VTASIPPRFGLGLVALLACAAPRFAARTGDTLPRSVTLSAGWLFQPDPNAVGDDQAWQGREFDRSGWRPVTVPMAWDHYDPVMDGYEGVGWYALALPAGLVVPGAWQRLASAARTIGSAVWRAVQAVPEVCGGIVWSWADYRHRRGLTNDFPTYFGPFGIVTFERRPKKAQAALRESWTGEPPGR
jgi:hypothetical protein